MGRLQQLVAVALLEWSGSPFPPLREKKIKAKKGIRALTKKIIKPVTRFPEVPNAARGKALEIKEI